MSFPFKPTEKWDVHTHTTLGPDTYEALSRFRHYTDFIRVRAHATKPCCAEMVNSAGKVQRVIEANAYDGHTRRVECDKHGVTMQVLSPTPMMIPDYVDNAADAAEICRILNDNNQTLVTQFPTRFSALAALPMQSTTHAIAEMERVSANGMRGVEINTNINGRGLDDPEFFPVFQAAEALNMAIFLHPWGGMMAPTEPLLKARMDKNWRAWLIGMGMETALAFDALRSGDVHARLPRLRVMYAHGGGAFPALLGRLEHGPYSRPDLFTEASKTDPLHTIRECGIYVDTLTHDPFALGHLKQIFGINRIAMGSDYPYPLGEMDMRGERHLYPGYMVEHLPETPEDMETAWSHFDWMPRDTADGPRSLPCLSAAEKTRLLAGTAKEWLAWN